MSSLSRIRILWLALGLILLVGAARASFDQITIKGATGQVIEVMLRDSTTGGGKTGVAHSAVTASYVREGATRQAITLAAGTAGDAWSSGKWAEVDATNCKGLYQLHLPDAALATGANAVTVNLQASGVIDKSFRIVLIDANLRDATRLGLAALPNAAADASGGLPLKSYVAPAASALSTVQWTNGRAALLDYLDAAISGRMAAGAVALQANQHVIADSVGDKTGYSLAGTQAFNLTGNITGNLSGSVGSVTGAVGSVTGNVGGNVAGSVGSVPAVTLAASQPNYAPAKAGDSMVSSNERGTDNALPASGYTAPPSAATIWGYGTRTLTSAGSSGATAQEVWEYAARTLTDKTGFSLAAGQHVTADNMVDLTATNAKVDAAKASADAAARPGASMVASNFVAAPTVAEILAGAVDGSVDLKTALKRLLAAVYNTATVSGSTDKTIQLKASDGTTNVGQQVIKGDGSGRVTTNQ